VFWLQLIKEIEKNRIVSRFIMSVRIAYNGYALAQAGYSMNFQPGQKYSKGTKSRDFDSVAQ
jgi:hypothetical protein